MFLDLLRILEILMITKMLLLPSFLALAAASDSKCTSKGGQCQDYTQHKCTAGYEQYLCDGSKFKLILFYLFHKTKNNRI